MSRTKRKGHYLESDKDYESCRYDSVRDKKKKYKPGKKFKKMKKKKERAKLKDALIKEKELPLLKKDNVWDWN